MADKIEQYCASAKSEQLLYMIDILKSSVVESRQPNTTRLAEIKSDSFFAVMDEIKSYIEEADKCLKQN